MQNIILFPSEGNRRTVPQVVITKSVQGNNVSKYKLQALQATLEIFDLTGATGITGTRKDLNDGNVYALTGTITITHEGNGEFEWTPSDVDTGLSGAFEVQFTVAFTGNTSSYVAIWNVEPLAGATAVGAPPLVGVPSDNADLLALLKLIADGASLNEILTFNGTGGFFAGTGGAGGGGIHLMEDPPLTTGWIVDIVPSIDGVGGGGLMQNITPSTTEYKINFASHPALTAAQQATANDRVVHGYLRLLDASFTGNNIEIYAAPAAAVAGIDPIIATGDGDVSGNIVIPFSIQMDAAKTISISTRNTPAGSINLTVVVRLNYLSLK